MNEGLRGTGAATGRVSGLAHVADIDGRVADVADGVVLVVRVFHPYFAPVLRRVTGLVVEEGGLLQHAVILAREFGVPTVVGVPHATNAIGSGDFVELDGSTGEVMVTPRPAADAHTPDVRGQR